MTPSPRLGSRLWAWALLGLVAGGVAPLARPAAGQIRVTWHGPRARTEILGGDAPRDLLEGTPVDFTVPVTGWSRTATLRISGDGFPSIEQALSLTRSRSAMVADLSSGPVHGELRLQVSGCPSWVVHLKDDGGTDWSGSGEGNATQAFDIPLPRGNATLAVSAAGGSHFTEATTRVSGGTTAIQESVALHRQGSLTISVEGASSVDMIMRGEGGTDRQQAHSGDALTLLLDHPIDIEFAPPPHKLFGSNQSKFHLDADHPDARVSLRVVDYPSLTIQAHVPGATAVLLSDDGETHPLQTEGSKFILPTGLELSPGKYTLKARKSGYSESQLSVKLRPGPNDFSVKLSKVAVEAPSTQPSQHVASHPSSANTIHYRTDPVVVHTRPAVSHPVTVVTHHEVKHLGGGISLPGFGGGHTQP